MSARKAEDFTPFLFMWEDQQQERKWEVSSKENASGMLEWIINQGVNPATVVMGYNPVILHWAFPDYHNGMRDVSVCEINKKIYGYNPVESAPKREPPKVPTRKRPHVPKFGWLAPDGRYFQCNYGAHSALADEIVGSIEYVQNSEQHLEMLGWCRIARGFHKPYMVCMGEGKKLTDKQIKTLEREKLTDSLDYISLFL